MSLFWVLLAIPVVGGIWFARNRRENRRQSLEMSDAEGRLQVLKRLNAAAGEANREEFSQEKKGQG
jgi:hypothetical protein